jgi:hypothetical protein
MVVAAELGYINGATWGCEGRSSNCCRTLGEAVMPSVAGRTLAAGARATLVGQQLESGLAMTQRWPQQPVIVAFCWAIATTFGEAVDRFKQDEGASPNTEGIEVMAMATVAARRRRGLIFILSFFREPWSFRVS